VHGNSSARPLSFIRSLDSMKRFRQGFVSGHQEPRFDNGGPATTRDGSSTMAKTTSHSTNGAQQEARSLIQPEAVFESYGRFMRQIESANRQWVGSIRQSAEAGWELATQMADTAIADARRMSDLYLRLCEMDLSAAAATMRHIGSETSAPASRAFAAMHRSAAAD
jgi:hypothetical protein